MIIQHNIMALNAHRQLGGNNTLVSKNLEKLSSGFKINRAGDDAAGLAISEKMRAQITGLSRAQANAQDGISLVQTAEGALTEVHSMLNRMVDLATQSANGTIKDFDRSKIQDEMDALSGEIDRISKATDFNGIKLLNGSLGGAAVTQTNGTAAGAGAGGTPAVAAVYDGGTATAHSANAKMTVNGFTSSVTIDGTAGNAAAHLAAFIADFNTTAPNPNWTASMNDAGDGLKFTAKTAGAFGSAGAPTAAPTGATVVTAGADAGAGAGGAAAKASTTVIDFDGKSGAQMFGGTMKIGNTTYEFTKQGTTATNGNTAIELADNDDGAAIAGKVQAEVTEAGFTATVGTTKVTLTEDAGDGTDPAPAVKFDKLGLVMQVGDTADSYNKVTVSVGDMSTKGLAIDGLKVDSQQAATESMAKIKDAINSVSTNRSALGALQNRLEHTINNLSVTTENMTAAESRIRDVDMAKEMMHFTKNNVLSQAAQAMLAQANQQPQQVLQLLR